MATGENVVPNPRVAIVTGGAQGIGAAIARRLATDGVAVAVLDQNLSQAQGVADSIRSSNARAVAINADVGNEQQVGAAVHEVTGLLGPPTILVNNAGFARDARIVDMSSKDWDDVHDVHLKGSFLMARAVTPHMENARWGRIVNISSISARGHADRVNYAAAKAGMHGLVRALAVELGPLGITANAIAPGLIVTAMTQATATRRNLDLADHLEDAVSRIPVGRAGHPDDIASAASFFASPDSGFITGQVLYVSGGAY